MAANLPNAFEIAVNFSLSISFLYFQNAIRKENPPPTEEDRQLVARASADFFHLGIQRELKLKPNARYDWETFNLDDIFSEQANTSNGSSDPGDSQSPSSSHGRSV
jgi:hypothetical protein